MKSSKLISSLEDNARAYERKLRQAESAISAANDRELHLENEIASALSTIADLYIQDGTADSEIQSHLTRRREEEEGARAKLRVAETVITEKTSQLVAVNAEIEDEQEKVLASLKANPVYIDLSNEHAALVDSQKRAQSRHDEIKAECKSKIQQYKDSSLYQYLKSAGYGTEAYSCRGFIRFMDGWIAELCNFDENFKNETLLIEMAAYNESSAAEISDGISRLHKKLDELCLKTESESKLKDLFDEKDSLQTSIASGKKIANTLHADIQRYVNKTDNHYARARDMLVGILGDISSKALLERAMKTQSPSDDAAAKKIAIARNELDIVRSSMPALENEASLTRKTYERAKRLERNMRDSSYSSSRYKYSDSLDLDALLAGYMTGSISEDAVASEVRSYRREVEESPSYYGSSSYGSSSSGGSSSGGSSSDSSFSFSSSSSSGGGSFSTSDSF